MPPRFIEDRRSVYWIDKVPLQREPEGVTLPKLNPRVVQLAVHKNASPHWRQDRPKAYRPVSEAAKTAAGSARLGQLAQPRRLHSLFQPEQSPYTVVTQAAKTSQLTPRTIQLCLPKPHKIWHISEDTMCEGPFCDPITPVTKTALGARCSDWLGGIAVAKREHPAYLRERPVRWPMSEEIRLAKASSRVCQLATPKARRMIKDDYNPYKVSCGARSANVSDRTCELARPFPWKIRQKKI